MEETEREATEETIYVYEYPANSQSDPGEEGKVITIESKESPEDEVTTVTQYVEEVVEIDNENVVVANVMAASEKGSIKLVLAEEDDNPGEHGYTMNYRPIRPVERQKMRPWLLEHLDSGSIPGLSWQNRTQRIFRISWKHAAHNCFNRTRDSDLFERWAYHTGRHHDGNHKRWKANFRCALNSLPDVIELRDLGVRKGDNAFKVYKFIDLNDEKEREEKKRLQMVTRSSKKTENKKGSSTPNTPAGSKQLKEASPPAAFSITTTEGGMLQTLLHAIELKNQEAATDKDDDKKSKEKIQLTVKRSLDQENQPRSKRSRRETGKNQPSEETESSEEEEDYETESQGSSTSHTPGATLTTPTSGQSVINMLKLPYILDMKQLLALAGSKQKDIEGKGQSQDKMTITNVTLDSVLQDRLTRNTDNSNVKITIPYTVFEALKAKNMAANKNPVTLEGTPSSVVLTQALDNNKDTTETTTKPQQTVVSSLTSNKEAAYPNIRSRLVSRLNISGAQVVGQGQIRPTLVPEGGKKAFEKVTVQAIPQLQPVNVGSSGEESEQDSKINISPVNINADVSQSEMPTSSQTNKASAELDRVTEQVTVELGELTEDQLSAEVVGGEQDNQFTADKREKRTVMTHCNLYLNAACPGCGLARDGLTFVIQSALDILKSPQYDTLSYQIPVIPSSPLVITNRRYFGCLEEDLDPVTVTLTPEGQLNINVLFKSLEKIVVKTERGELDVQTFQWTLDRLVGNVFCPGVSVTHYPDHWDVPVREFEEPFRHVQSLTCPVWYSAERCDEFPISMCGGCQDATESLAVKEEETIETEIIVMDPEIAEQVFEGSCNISHVEVSEEVTDEM